MEEVHMGLIVGIPELAKSTGRQCVIVRVHCLTLVLRKRELKHRGKIAGRVRKPETDIRKYLGKDTGKIRESPKLGSRGDARLVEHFRDRNVSWPNMCVPNLRVPSTGDPPGLHIDSSDYVRAFSTQIAFLRCVSKQEAHRLYFMHGTLSKTSDCFYHKVVPYGLATSLNETSLVQRP